MSRYPTSCLDGSASDAFRTVLDMHRAGPRVLDLTYSDGISWGDPCLTDQDFELVRSDIKPPYGQDLFTCLDDRPEWRDAFDVVYYDPPWFVDIEADSADPRAAAYGDYDGHARPLQDYIDYVTAIPALLKDGGRLILKCSDQYHVKTRRLLLLRLDWCAAMAEARLAIGRMAPFGLATPHALDRIAEAARAIGVRPCEVWCAAGSGVLARGLAQAWPNARQHVVQVGRTLDMIDAPGATVYPYPLPYDRAVASMDFPSDPHYEAKAWEICKSRHGAGVVVFWNVIGPPVMS